MATDKMHLNDGVAIQLEQIEPWSDKQSPEELAVLKKQYEAYGSPMMMLEQPGSKDCAHTVKTDVTSQYSLIPVLEKYMVVEGRLVMNPMPKGTMVLQCVECKELFIEAS